MEFLFLFMDAQSIPKPVARGILLNIRSYYPLLKTSHVFHVSQSKTEILAIFCPLSLDLSDLPIFHCSPFSSHSGFHAPATKSLHLLCSLLKYSSSKCPHGLYTQLFPISAQITLFHFPDQPILNCHTLCSSTLLLCFSP